MASPVSTGATASSTATGSAGGTGAAAGGTAGGVSRPDSASARAVMPATSSTCVAGRSSSSTSRGMAATASRTIATTSADRGSVWLITRFSRLSMLQANSPRRRAPTMRPLPFSVWKIRRTSASACASSGLRSQSGKLSPRCAMFSRASSTKIARNSASTMTGSGAAGGGAEGGGGTSVRIAIVGSTGATVAGSAGATAAAGSPPGREGTSVTTLAPAAPSSARHASALSSRCQGSGRPACKDSM